MSREIALRLKCPAIVSKRINDASSSQFFILQELGPTAFVLKQQESDDKFKVGLGSRQSCSCSSFIMKKELCIHILWVMIKIFHVAENSELLYQKSLLEREVLDLIDKRRSHQSPIINTDTKDSQEKESNQIQKGHVPLRPISETDVCPICQECLKTNNAPLTYCKLSCGNAIHVKCMKVLMDHQIGSLGLSTVKCPLCRNDFGTIEEMQNEFLEAIQSDRKRIKEHQRKPRHPGYQCRQCQMDPIVGKCHSCTSCSNLSLCDDCFTSGAHSQHSFQYRTYKGGKSNPSTRAVTTILPDAFIQDLENREITDADYETLLLLDSGPTQQASIPLHIINSFPVYKVTSLSMKTEYLKDGICKICISQVAHGQIIRKIPCGCSYHKDCIDRWLLTQRSTCPTCGLAAYTNIQNDQEESEKRFIASDYGINLVKKKSKKPKSCKKETTLFVTQEKETNAFEIIGLNSFVSKREIIKSNSLNVQPTPKQQEALNVSLQSLTITSPILHSHSKPLFLSKDTKGKSPIRRESIDLIIGDASKINTKETMQFVSSPIIKKKSLKNSTLSSSSTDLTDLNDIMSINRMT